MATYEEIRMALRGVMPSSVAYDFRETFLQRMEKKGTTETVDPAEYILMECWTCADLRKERPHVQHLGSRRNQAAGLDPVTYPMMTRLLRTRLPEAFREELRVEESYLEEARTLGGTRFKRHHVTVAMGVLVFVVAAWLLT